MFSDQDFFYSNDISLLLNILEQKNHFTKLSYHFTILKIHETTAKYILQINKISF